MIVWLDLETTGLDPLKGSILEIAMIATDDNFEQIGEPFVSIVQPLHLRGWEVMDKYVRDMHTKSGLIEQLYNIGSLFHGESASFSLLPDLPRLGDVERAVITWLRSGFSNRDTAAVNPDAEPFKKAMKATPLGGNTVHFDKRFLIEHMDELEALFSHRIYDVSSFTEEVKRSAPEVYKRRPGLDANGKPVPQHRALDDIRNSIATAKFYRESRKWMVTA